MMKYAVAALVLIFAACKGNDQQQNNDETQDLTVTKTEEAVQDSAIVFFGNSLSAGYGISPDSAFPALIQHRLDSQNYHYKVVNAGVSGETTATGKNRVAWVVQRQPVAIFVLELGGNDGLRGISPKETRQNLEAIIDSVRSYHPQAKVVLAGMMVPPNMGADYSKAFMTVFPEVAKSKQVSLIPFLLQGVGGIDSLNQADGIHPTATGHGLVAENVWQILKPLLQP